jgi:hypothetical protein
LIAALTARPGVLHRAWPGVLLAQTCLAGNTAPYGGLHALDGLLAVGIAGFLYASARRWQA